MLSETMIEEAKHIDLPALLQDKNIPLIPQNGGSAFKALCPFHNDTNPSLHLSLKGRRWLWNCFACGAGGTAIDFVMRHDNKVFQEAVSDLAGHKNIAQGRAPLPKAGAPQKKEASSQRNKMLTQVSEHFHKNLFSENGEKGRIYLKKRGLWDEALIKTFKIGFSDNTLRQHFDQDRHYLRTELGLFKPNYWETFANCVVFPVHNEKGEASDLYARRVFNYSDRSNHCYNKGHHQSLFNLKNVQDTETILLTEGIIDALTLYKSGFHNVTALYGVNGMTEMHKKIISKSNKLILALDNDLAGEKARIRLADQFSERVVFKVTYPGNIKDMNELYLKHGSSAVKHAIQQAEKIEPTLSKDPPSLNVPLKPTTTLMSENKFQLQGDDLIFQSAALTYKIRGVGKLRNLDHLRFVIRVNAQAQSLKTAQRVCTDRVDLYGSRSRKSFEKTLAKEFDVQAAVIEKDLHDLVAHIEANHQRQQNHKQTTPIKKTMPAGAQEEALQFLKSKNLIQSISADLSVLGYVGEDNNKLLLYLGGTSRKLDKPISILIRSQSSTGKSFLMKTICACLPPEDICQWTSMTKQALYYMSEDALKHKLIAIDERAGMIEAEYPIRSLQSDGKLSLAVPIKNPVTNQIETQQISKEGPIAYVDGSTETQSNPENANRCFEIFLDESQAQTLRVHAQQKNAHTLEGRTRNLEKDAIKAKHQNAQRLLKPLKVVIPYTGSLTFPSDWIRTRRDHDRFLSLIICITFLHQYQREHKTYKNTPYIEATVEDYAIAYKIAQSVLFHTFNELDKPTQDFYQHIQQQVQEESMRENIPVHEYAITRRQVRQWTKLPDHVVKRMMRTLEDMEYFDVKKGPHGSRYVYTIAQNFKKESLLTQLTTPEYLRQKLSQTRSLANE